MTDVGGTSPLSFTRLVMGLEVKRLRCLLISLSCHPGTTRRSALSHLVFNKRLTYIGHYAEIGCGIIMSNLFVEHLIIHIV